MNKGKSKDLRGMMSWVFPTVFLMLGVVNLFNSETPMTSCLLLIASGVVFFPSVKTFLEKYMNKYLSLFSRFTLFLVFFTLAINITRSEKSSSQFTSLKHKTLYIKIFEDDFLKSLHGKETLISKNDWLKSLKIRGKVHANTILKDFDLNEVSANKKYEGSWLIKGRVRSIDDGFRSAIVGIGGQSKIFNFGAHLKNKDRIATYSVGKEVLIYCNEISETISFISGYKCQDYNDWKFEAIATILQNPQSIKINKDNSLSLKEYIQKTHTAVNTLPNSSSCFEKIKSVKCAFEIKAAIKTMFLD